MQKWLALGFAGVTAAFVAALFVWRPTKATHTPAAAVQDAGIADAQASASASGPTDAGGDAGDLAAQPSASADDPQGGIESPFATSDAGITLLNGSVAPPLAGDAPKSVVFGVILITYKGAQGAPPNARSRDAALDLAKALVADAKQDFKAALAKGDKGSTENLGHMPRGILEPAPEYVLFSLPKDGVSDPVDTPRGFWIVHRIE